MSGRGDAAGAAFATAARLSVSDTSGPSFTTDCLGRRAGREGRTAKETTKGVLWPRRRSFSLCRQGLLAAGGRCYAATGGRASANGRGGGGGGIILAAVCCLALAISVASVSGGGRYHKHVVG